MAGTDPVNSEDAFRITDIHLDPASGKPVIAWSTVADRIYTVITAPDVTGPWTNRVAEFSAIASGRQGFTNNTGVGTNVFLRVAVRTSP